MPPENLEWVKGKQIDLFIESFSSAAHTVQVRGYSDIEQISSDHTTNSDRSLATSTVRLTSIPKHLTLRTAATGVKRGVCYVKVSLRVDQAVIALLCAGYVTDTGTQAFPNGKIESSLDGPGLVRTITGTDQAAGVNISETVPTGARWKLRSILFTLVTSATVTTRVVQLEIDDGTTVSWFFRDSSGQAASVTRRYLFANNFQSRIDPGSDNQYMTLLLDAFLLAGYRIKTNPDNFQAGDNFGAPIYIVEEWIEL